jgi:hypothetical protein
MPVCSLFENQYVKMFDNRDFCSFSNKICPLLSDYLLLFRGGDHARANDLKFPERRQAHIQKWMQWMGTLTEQGKFVGAQLLEIPVP